MDINQQRPSLNIKYYEIENSEQIFKIIEDIKERYGSVRNLIPQSVPLDLTCDRKVISLKFFNMNNNVVKISGPGLIIDDIFTIWFAKNLRY